MKKLISILALITLYITANATTPDSITVIKPNINNSPINTGQYFIISRYRNLMTEALCQKDTVKIKALLNYAEDKLKNETHTVLSPSEFWILALIYGEYQLVIDQIENYKYEDYQKYKERFSPPMDDLHFAIQKNSSFYDAKTIKNIDKSDLEEVDKEFLKNFVEWTKPIVNDHDIDRRNNEVDAFLSKYKYTPYENYIRSNFRFVYKPINQGFSINFGFNFGKSFIDGDLDDVIRNKDCGDIYIQCGWNNLRAELSANFNDYELKTDKYVSGTIFRKGNDLCNANISNGIGYQISIARKINFTPYVGVHIATSKFFYNDDNKDRIEEKQCYIKPYAAAELNYQFITKPILDFNTPIMMILECGIRYTYSPYKCKFDDGTIDGQIHSIAINFAKLKFCKAQRDF